MDWNGQQRPKILFEGEERDDVRFGRELHDQIEIRADFILARRDRTDYPRVRGANRCQSILHFLAGHLQDLRRPHLEGRIEEVAHGGRLGRTLFGT